MTTPEDYPEMVPIPVEAVDGLFCWFTVEDIAKAARASGFSSIFDLVTALLQSDLEAIAKVAPHGLKLESVHGPQKKEFDLSSIFANLKDKTRASARETIMRKVANALPIPANELGFILADGLTRRMTGQTLKPDDEVRGDD